jgi:hypothetical protein
MIVNEAWKKLLARVEFNKDAIAAQGWYPLIRNPLDHPEISAPKENEQEKILEMDSSHGASNRSTAATLNFNNGIANTLLWLIFSRILTVRQFPSK